MRRLIEHFRLPESLVKITCDESLSSRQGFFKFGDDAVCFGSCSSGRVAAAVEDSLYDVRGDVRLNADGCHLPFDPDQIVDNLLLERYPVRAAEPHLQAFMRTVYYGVRPLLPVSVRSYLQRMYLSGWEKIPFPSWPVDCTVERTLERCLMLLMKAQNLQEAPFIWFWPRGYESCAMVTHDVEAHAGKDFCPKLMDLDDSCGVKSAFQVIPEERYSVSEAFLAGIRDRGFEVNVHDLNHDGKLFLNERQFMERVVRINRYGEQFGSAGFRAGVMYRNLEWCHALKFEYDMSVPNAAHLEPQRGGCCTVFPYFIGKLVELPLTTTQDYALFHFLGDHSLKLWQWEIELLRQNHGLITILVHPDYITEKRETQIYLELLGILDALRREKNVWIAKPGEVNAWWRLRNSLKVVPEGAGWRIEGAGSDRACLAYAQLEGEKIGYRIEGGKAEPAQRTSVPEPAVMAEVGDARSFDRKSLAAGACDSRCAHSVPVFEANRREVGARQPAERKSLNVCMLAYTFYESDNRVMRYAETLAARGDRVDVFALRQTDGEPDAVISGVNVFKIQTRVYDEKGKGAYVSRLLSFLARSSRIIEKRHRQIHYDLIHVHSVPDFLVFAAWLPKLTGAKVVLDIHDILPEFYASKFGSGRESFIFKLLVMVERLSAHAAHHVIIANDLWRERLVERSVPEGKCTTILNFPDRNIFHCNGRNRHDGRFIILYPGSLNWHQGVDIAIRAFARIQNEAPAAEFHIYGGGPEKQKLTDLVRELGLERRVFLYEAVPLRDIVRVMKDADLAVVPKRGDSFGNEAFSTKTLEFMALGVPLIVAATTIDKYYFNDTLVRFFRCGDEQELAAAMLQLIQDPNLRERLVRNGLEFAARYDWESNKARYMNIVDSLTVGPQITTVDTAAQARKTGTK